MIYDAKKMFSWYGDKIIFFLPQVFFSFKSIIFFLLQDRYVSIHFQRSFNIFKGSEAHYWDEMRCGLPEVKELLDMMGNDDAARCECHAYCLSCAEFPVF